MTAPDPEKVRARVKALSYILASHAGGVELVEGGPADVVRLRFTGLCGGCWMKPITLAKILRPGLEDLEGVAAVEVEGVRFSEQSLKQIA